MEHLPDFRLHRPATVAEAVALRAEETEARYLAGGTDMVVNIRRGIEQPATLVDLNAIEGFAAIEENAGGLVIGAGATLDILAAREDVRRDYSEVAEAAGDFTAP